MKKTILKLRDVSVAYKKKSEDFIAVENVNLNINKGEFVCIIGLSGCGKTTLLYAIAGLLEIRRGEIIFDDKVVNGPAAARGMVFQQDSVFPWLTVYQNIAYGLKTKKMSKDKINQIVRHYIKIVELEKFENSFPRELSGGMKKRVDLARAFANDPEILLMDEPFGSLDAMTKESLQIELLKLWKENRKTIIFVTHDIEEALFISQKTIVMASSHRIIKTIKVPFDYPRKSEVKTSLEFQKLRASLRELLS